ncbi:hypothetical protein AQF52_7872 [Streptomyces venezuelae]|nr:hypothetical protein AQF52_7872 [Streptomyces venezuelae]CUM35820.1 hypothetical protein BN2537_605 [Streptomyces venezuelae]
MVTLPPLTSCPSPREQPTVAVCPVEAVFGPLTVEGREARDRLQAAPVARRGAGAAAE